MNSEYFDWLAADLAVVMPFIPRLHAPDGESPLVGPVQMGCLVSQVSRVRIATNRQYSEIPTPYPGYLLYV